jgi:methionyl aminopeptidase
MQGKTNESVGELFQTDLLQAARDKSLEVLSQVALKIQAGMTEIEATQWLQKIQENLGSTKSWHPPQIRFGENTLLPFGQKGQENIPLKTNDIFFLDIGPLFDGHEGDVGRTFVVGQDPDMLKCREDVETIWTEVRNFWAQNNASGEQLYKFADQSAQSKGWKLCLQKANGHRISDFPHAARIRGSIEGFQKKPAPNRWILEIQIRHPEKAFGAFFEDLLN